MKKIIVEKLYNNELQIIKQSATSYQSKIYVGCVNNAPKYIYKSFKTDDLTIARELMKKHYHKTKYELDQNIIVKQDVGQNRFIKFVEQYLTEVDWKQSVTHQNDERFAKKIIHFIKDEKIKKLDYVSLIKFKEQYLTKFTNSDNTIAHHINFIRKVYRHHRKLGRITKLDVPEMPSVKKTAGKRTYFTFDEYRKLIDTSIQRMNEEVYARNVQLVRKSLNRFIIFMIGSGLRSEESYNLKWDQVQFRRNVKSNFCSLDLTKSKTGARRVTTKSSSYNALKELQKVYTDYEDEFERQQLDKRYVFPFKYHSSLRQLLKSCDLYFDKTTNQYRNATSFRKTYISWGLINGENIYDIAKNCGNTVGVIEKYYAKHVTSKDLEERLSSLRVVK